jgi:transposase
VSHACHHRVAAQKKSLRAQERDEGVRCAYRLQLLQQAAETFVIVDESGYNLDMTPTYGRAPAGVRVYEQPPRNTPPNTTLIAALSTSGIQAPLLVEGSANHLTIEAYVEHVLAPTLRPGQIVVLDNLSAHKRARLEGLLAAKQCKRWFLPAYSPDLAPIELACAKIKLAVRRAAARTKEALEAAIAQALASVTPADARAFFAHCGYLLASPMLN